MQKRQTGTYNEPVLQPTDLTATIDDEGLHDPDGDDSAYNDADFAGEPMPPVGGWAAQTRIILPTLGEIDAALQALEHERMAERRRYIKAKRHLTDTRKFVIKQGATG